MDFGYARVMVRDGKGAKDRVTMLPVNLAAGLERHLQKVKAQFEEDLEDGVAGVYLPYALAKKIRTQSENGAGSGPFLRRGFRKILGQRRKLSTRNGGII